MYFADDDNLYTASLLEKLRRVERVGVFGIAFNPAVGQRGGRWIEHGHFAYPLCDSDKRVWGFHTRWVGDDRPQESDTARRFAVDISQFAVNSKYLFDRPHDVLFDTSWSSGRAEDNFLKAVLAHVTNPLAALEVLADDADAGKPPRRPLAVHQKIIVPHVTPN